MGRRSSVATTVASGADSSPSSAETSFRELDDVFLQTQTRIWLGEVLKLGLDEQLSVSDLLADGELLFEVSKTLWSLLLEKCVELRRIKAYQFPIGSRKSSGRYKPYSNVDSFLKVCKILGLNGIDLFSPSDVVEKRNTRKVCICIRAISKKARSKQLNVPDFDLVTYAVVMPTDMVGCIRRSLESSQCSVSSCSSSTPYKQTRSRSQQRKLTSSQNGNYDSCSEDSDEAESAYFGIESYSSSMEKSDHPGTLNLDSENSPGAFSAVKQYTRQVTIQSDTRNPYGNAKPCFVRHSGNDNQANNLSTCYFKSRADLHNKDMHTNNDIRDSFKSMSELADVDLALGNDNSGTGDSMFDNIVGTDFISDYLAFSDFVVLGNNPSSSLLVNGEENVCNFFMSIDSHGIDSMPRTFPNGFHQRSLDDMEDVEVSSTASMSSILGRVLNMDFDDQYNGGDSSMAKVHSIIRLFEKGTESQDKFSFMEDQTQDSSLCEILSQCSATDEQSHSEAQLENEGICPNFNSYPENNGQPYIMESKKLDICGHSQVPRITFCTDSTDLAPVENDKSSFERMDLKKAVIGASDLNPDLEPHSSDHIPLNSLHRKICTEAKVSFDKFSVEGNESHICSLGYERVTVKSVTCPELQEKLNGNIVNYNFNSIVNENESMAEEHLSPFAKNATNVTGGGHQTCTGRSGSSHLSSSGNEDFQNENNIDISTDKFSDGKDQRCSAQQNKARKQSLLNTVVTGTTLIGVLFFLFHIRKGKEDTNKPQKPLKSQGFGAAKPTSQRRKSNGRSNGTYPAEKLKFGS